MVYYQDDDVLIRDLRESDARVITDEEIAQGWEASIEKYRRHGIGSRLMDAAEQIASNYADTVYLGVGLHSGYGSAQRMYVRRGYLPDGSGVWFQDRVCEPYASCCNDDDLNLYFSKKLR